MPLFNKANAVPAVSWMVAPPSTKTWFIGIIFKFSMSLSKLNTPLSVLTFSPDFKKILCCTN